MQHRFQIASIGQIQCEGDEYVIQLEEQFIPGLTNIAGFSHLQILWWGHRTDTQAHRHRYTVGKLFKQGPDTIGIFATRAPARPNPILVSTIQVSSIDVSTGIITTPFIDAEPGSPVVDIKPYFPMERVRECASPPWCQHWPEWAEEAAQFPWEQEIHFENSQKT